MKRLFLLIIFFLMFLMVIIPDTDRKMVYVSSSARIDNSVSSETLDEPMPLIVAEDTAQVSLQEHSDTAEKINIIQSKILIKADRSTIEYDLVTGTANFYYDGKMIVNSFYGGVKYPQLITSKDYPSRSSAFDGKTYTITLSDGNNPTMKQHFTPLEQGSFTLSVELEGQNLSSNYMAPIMVDKEGSVTIEGNDLIALWIPFDNDRNAKYDASSINREDISYEAAAFYDNESRNGLVVGSVTHDTWKTGIYFKGAGNKLDNLQVFGGVSIQNERHNGTMMRDLMPHGQITGNTIASPKIFLGYFEDWRFGMEAYADTNASIVPKLQWDGGVPFGWNSWGAVGDKLNTEKALKASEFISEELMTKGFINDGTTYINLDSYWDSPSVNLEKFVSAVHQNGQKAGIYWAPFVDWIKNPDKMVEGSTYTYRDAWLKDDYGNPITYGNGPYTMDPTHPATLKRIDYFLGLFKRKGFDQFIKIDFLTHGALEGNHFDPAVTTGMQAFNRGMQHLYDTIMNTMGQNTFISQAISPLFPYQYAHARRVSCDKFGFLYESRELLNSVAYGWWMNDRIYSYNDPDHMVLYHVWWNGKTKLTENEAKTRVTSAVVSGTVFLSGDDFSDPKAKERALKYLTNENINRIAKMSRAFIPVEGNTGTDAPNVYVMKNDNDYYIAVFNWDSGNKVKKTIHLERAGLDPDKTYEAIEQWTDEGSMVTGKMDIELEPGETNLFKLK